MTQPPPSREEEDVLLRDGEQVDRYVVRDIVGRGGLAVVYRVEHAQLKSPFALKQLLVTSPFIRRRLRQEGMVQANVRHPNLVLVTDMIDLSTGPGLVMEYVDGPTLEQLLANGVALDEEVVDRIAEGLIAGVAAAHARSLVHRDLKPANVLLEVTPSGYVPRITDFGFVKVITGDADIDLSVTQPGIKLGTPRYMAPEQATDARSVDAGADIYALGAVLYELATGWQAFQHPSDEIAQMEQDKMADQYIPPRTVRPDMPARWERAIVGALKADRGARIGSAEELLALWRGGARAAGPVVAVSGEARTSAHGRRTSRVAVPLLAGLGVLALVAVALLWPSDEGSPKQDIEVISQAPAPVPVAPTREPGPPASVPAAEPEPEAAPEPPKRRTAAKSVPTPAPVAAPVDAAPPPPDPGPAPVPDPAPEAEPEPDAVAAMAPGHGMVEIAGDAVDVFLQRDGQNLLPGGVPAGTYKVVQVVSGAQPVAMGSVTVVAGERTTIRCSSRLKRCK